MLVLGTEEEANSRFVCCKGDDGEKLSCGEAPKGSGLNAVCCKRLSQSDLAVAQTCDGDTELLGRWGEQDDEPCRPRDADARVGVGLHSLTYFLLLLNSGFRDEEGRRRRSISPLVLHLDKKFL